VTFVTIVENGSPATDQPEIWAGANNGNPCKTNQTNMQPQKMKVTETQNVYVALSH